MDEKQKADIQNRCGYHKPPTPEDGGRIEMMRETIQCAMMDVARYTPPGREQALALTNLEQALFWANAAIARQWPLTS